MYPSNSASVLHEIHGSILVLSIEKKLVKLNIHQVVLIKAEDGALVAVACATWRAGLSHLEVRACTPEIKGIFATLERILYQALSPLKLHQITDLPCRIKF